MSSSEKINREIEQRAKEYREQKNDPLKPLRDLRAGAEPKNIEAALRLFDESCRGKDDLEVAVLRDEAIKELERIKCKSPAGLIDVSLKLIKRTEKKNLQGQDIVFPQPLPWEEAVDGSELLNEVAAFICKFVVFEERENVACATWVSHTWFTDVIDFSPILGIVSPEKRCGKSTLLRVLKLLVSKPYRTASASVSAIFRLVEMNQPTLLIDELDSFMEKNEELRGLLNEGVERNGAFSRTVGDSFEPRAFRVFCPKALSLIGSLPGTVEDRTILIKMKRKVKRDRVERFQERTIAPLAGELCRKLLRFANDSRERLSQADPEIPEALNDRQADCWRPLIAVADLAGGEWPRKVREAAVALSGSGGTEEQQSAAVLLLSDIKTFFEEKSFQQTPTADLLEYLVSLDEKPWSEWRHGKPLNAHTLARLLRPFGVSSRTVRERARVFKGYVFEEFADAFLRYIPSQTVTSLQSAPVAVKTAFFDPLQTASVTASKSEENSRQSCIVTDVTDRNPESVPVGGYEEDDWASIYGEAGVMDL